MKSPWKVIQRDIDVHDCNGQRASGFKRKVIVLGVLSLLVCAALKSIDHKQQTVEKSNGLELKKANLEWAKQS